MTKSILEVAMKQCPTQLNVVLCRVQGSREKIIIHLLHVRNQMNFLGRGKRRKISDLYSQVKINFDSAVYNDH